MKKAFFSVFVLATLFALDFFLKRYAVMHIPHIQGGEFPFGGIGLFHHVFGIDCSLNYVGNKGVAWGVLGEFQQLFLWIRIGVVSCLFFFLFSMTQFIKKPPKMVQEFQAFSVEHHWILLVLLAGVLGNVSDYFLYGHVVDFIHLILFGYDYPIFNFADSLIFLSAVYLFFRGNKKTESTKTEINKA